MSFNIKHGLIDEPTDLGLRLDAQVCVRARRRVSVCLARVSVCIEREAEKGFVRFTV